VWGDDDPSARLRIGLPPPAATGRCTLRVEVRDFDEDAAATELGDFLGHVVIRGPELEALLRKSEAMSAGGGRGGRMGAHGEASHVMVPVGPLVADTTPAAARRGGRAANKKPLRAPRLDYALKRKARTSESQHAVGGRLSIAVHATSQRGHAQVLTAHGVEAVLRAVGTVEASGCAPAEVRAVARAALELLEALMLPPDNKKRLLEVSAAGWLAGWLLQCNAMQCNAMQCNAMQCNAAMPPPRSRRRPRRCWFRCPPRH